MCGSIDKHRIIIIGQGFSARLGIARSLASLNCEVFVLSSVLDGRFKRIMHFNAGRPIDCYSKFISEYYYCRWGNDESLLKILESKCVTPKGKTIIIPDSDSSAMLVDRYHDRLSKYFLFPHIAHEPGAVELWMDKLKQKALAEEGGLNVAEGCTFLIRGGKFDIPKGIVYPCFTKACVTVNGGKQFLRRSDNEQELTSFIGKMALRYPDTKVLVEAYKSIDREFAVVGVSDGQNVIIPGVIEFIESSRSHPGIARRGNILPPKGFENIIAQFKEYVRRMGFVGMFDIDFFESDAKMYFGEMNLRFGGSGYAYTASGVSIPELYVRMMLGEDISSFSGEVTKEQSYVNERMCLDDYSRGFITEEECRRLIDSSDIKFVYDINDPKPYSRMMREIRIIRLKRLRRKFLHKI